MSKRKRAAVKIAALIIVFALFNNSISDASEEHSFVRDSASAGVFAAHSGHDDAVVDDEDDDILDYIAEDEDFDEDYDGYYVLADDAGDYDAAFEIARREVPPIGAGGYFSPNFTLAGQSFNGGSIFGQGFGVGFLGGGFPAQASGGFGFNPLGAANLALGASNVGAFGQSFATGEGLDEDGGFGGGDGLGSEDLAAADSGDDENGPGIGGNGDENNNAAQDGGGDDNSNDDDEPSGDGGGAAGGGGGNGSPSDVEPDEDTQDGGGVAADDTDDAAGGGSDDDNDDMADSAATASPNPDDPDEAGDSDEPEDPSEADETDDSEDPAATQQNTPNPFTGDNHSTRSLIISALGFVASSGVLFYIYFRREQSVN